MDLYNTNFILLKGVALPKELSINKMSRLLQRLKNRLQK
jgi:hypothetical protein